MRVLLTGCGVLGRVIVRRRPADWELVVLDVADLDVSGVAPGNGAARPGSVRFVRGDVRDPAALREAVAGVDAIVHTAGPHGMHLAQVSPPGFMDVNVSGTVQLLEAAVEHGVRRFVFSSTVGVLGARLEGWSPSGPWIVDHTVPPLGGNVYVLSKILAEQACDYYARTHGIEVVVLRYGRLREEGEVPSMNLALSGQLTDVRDAAHANLAAAAAPGLRPPLTINLVPPTIVRPADGPRLGDVPATDLIRERLCLDPEVAGRLQFPSWAWLTDGPGPNPVLPAFNWDQGRFVRDALAGQPEG